MNVNGSVSGTPSFAFSGVSPSFAQFGRFAMIMEFVDIALASWLTSGSYSIGKFPQPPGLSKDSMIGRVT